MKTPRNGMRRLATALAFGMPMLPARSFPFLTPEVFKTLGVDSVRALVTDPGYVDQGGSYGKEALVVRVRSSELPEPFEFNFRVSQLTAAALTPTLGPNSDKWVGTIVKIGAHEYPGTEDGKPVTKTGLVARLHADAPTNAQPST